MKKKNLVILLLIPFIISLLGIVTINVTFNFIETDIAAIKWDYDDVEGFQIRENPYKLTATGEKLSGAVLAYGNELTWKGTLDFRFIKLQVEDPVEPCCIQTSQLQNCGYGFKH